MKLKRIIDKVLNKLDWRISIPLFASARRKRLKTTKFTIISNNCWGGRLYEYFNLPKQTPTVGLYFFSDDYLKFCSNLQYYLSRPLELFTASESAHKDDLYKKNEMNVIVGKLDDVELVFLHYHDEKTIREKWERRISRINWNNIVLKFSYQNNCSPELIKQFCEIEGFSKICFCGKKIIDSEDLIVYPRCNGLETIDETENFGRYFNVTKLINSKI